MGGDTALSHISVDSNDDKKILVATTEMISDEDIDLYIKSI